MDKFKQLDKLTEQGLLRKVEDGDLVLWNYTDKCTFERAWDEYTLNARGTVYRKSTGEVVAKAFPKFFNFTELPVEKQQAILAKEVPYDKYNSYDKPDGSLGIVYHDGTKWRVNTRGSFTSDQALKATEMLSRYNMDAVPKWFTLLVEIIYPDNKIIVNYGCLEELILLGGYDTQLGMELPIMSLHNYTGMSMVDEFDYTIEEMIELQKTIPKDKEGFVVKFSNGERVKFKGAEYLQIARILKGCSPLALWEKMIDGEVDVEFVQSIPEEIFPEIKPVIETLEQKYQDVAMAIYITVQGIRNATGVSEDMEMDNEARKRVGLYLKENKLTHSGVVFPFLLRKHDSVQQYIMKLIRPKRNIL